MRYPQVTASEPQKVPGLGGEAIVITQLDTNKVSVPVELTGEGGRQEEATHQPQGTQGESEE